jgi:hypothetical protein
MAEKKVSVRLAATGGAELRRELQEVGRTGRDALKQIADGAGPATAGLGKVEGSAGAAIVTLENLAARAARVAQNLRAAGASTGSLVDRVNRVTGVSAPVTRSAADIEAFGRALDDTRAKFNPLFAVIRLYRTQLAEIRQAHAVGAIGAGEMTAAISRERQAALASIAALKGRTTALIAIGAASGLARFRMQQLSFQLNDIGVSLAGGQNPLTVLVQQGARIAQLYGFGGGGVAGALRDVGRMIGGIVTRFPLVTAAIVAAGVATAGLTHEINQTTDAGVSMGDTLLAVWQVIRDGVGEIIRPAVETIAPLFAAAWDAVVTATRAAGNAIINANRATVFAITTFWDEVPKALGRAIFASANAVIAGVEGMLNAVIERINSFISLIDAALGQLPEFARPGQGLGEIGRVELGGIANPFVDALSGPGIRQKIDEGVSGILAEDPLGAFFGDVRERAIVNARRRQAEEEKTGGGGRAAAQTEERDAAEELIASLNRELAVLRETDPVQRRIIEQSDQLARATEGQRLQVEGLVRALDEEQSGFAAIGRVLGEFAQDARRIGDDIGNLLTGAFDSAADAVGEFVTTGRLRVRDLVSSIIADFARIAAQRFITAPLSEGLGGIFDSLLGAAGGLFGAAPATAPVPVARPRSFDGGGHTGFGARAGGLDGRGGFLAMLHPRERVIDETRGAGGRGGAGDPAPVVVNINARDAQSFRQSRTQVAADIARAVSLGRRGM